jgi:hypothetical protein
LENKRRTLTLPRRLSALDQEPSPEQEQQHAERDRKRDTNNPREDDPQREPLEETASRLGQCGAWSWLATVGTRGCLLGNLLATLPTED